MLCVKEMYDTMSLSNRGVTTLLSWIPVNVDGWNINVFLNDKILFASYLNVLIKQVYNFYCPSLIILVDDHIASEHICRGVGITIKQKHVDNCRHTL